MADTKITDLAALAAPVPADLVALVDVSDTSMAASGTDKQATLAALLGVLTSNVISGLTLSNNGTDPTNDLDIATGVATVTDGSAWYLAPLTSGLTKQLDANWAVGTDAGGLDTGSKSTSTWYHVWLIQRSDTGVVDVLFSLSSTAPTMPTNYDRKRRIGAIYNNASNAIDAFSQLGDRFLWASRTADVTAADPGTSAVLRTLTVPTGVQVLADVVHSLFDNSYSSATYALLSSPDASDVAASVTANTLIVNGTGLSTFAAASSATIRTNTSGQIRSRLSGSDADRTLRIQTTGWTDPRGNV